MEVEKKLEGGLGVTCDQAFLKGRRGEGGYDRRLGWEKQKDFRVVENCREKNVQLVTQR